MVTGDEKGERRKESCAATGRPWERKGLETAALLELGSFPSSNKETCVSPSRAIRY